MLQEVLTSMYKNSLSPRSYQLMRHLTVNIKKMDFFPQWQAEYVAFSVYVSEVLLLQGHIQVILVKTPCQNSEIHNTPCSVTSESMCMKY